MRRGTIKAFRQWMNEQFSKSENWTHGRYYQSTRGYGDYLYFQDRAKFDVELADAIKQGWKP